MAAFFFNSVPGDGRIACPVPGDAAKLVARQG
jgi:hypothetical protein